MFCYLLFLAFTRRRGIDIGSIEISNVASYMYVSEGWEVITQNKVGKQASTSRADVAVEEILMSVSRVMAENRTKTTIADAIASSLCISFHVSNKCTEAEEESRKDATTKKVHNAVIGLAPSHLSLDLGPFTCLKSPLKGGMGLKSKRKSKTQFAGTLLLKELLNTDATPPPAPPTSAMRLK